MKNAKVGSICLQKISADDTSRQRVFFSSTELEKIESAFMDRTVLQIKDVRGRNGNLDYELSKLVFNPSVLSVL